MKVDRSIAILAAAAAMALLAVVGIARLAPVGGNGVSQGKALVGGAFSLVDHTGRRVTDRDFRGKYLLVYFGYTHCPEICPTSLQTIADAMDRLGPIADEVVPLFVTVDPDRDGVKEMADYVANFDRRTVGLTGSRQEVDDAGKAYRVYSKLVVSEGAVDYDHSAIVFLMGRDGGYISHFSYGVDGERMAAGIRKAFDAREPQKLSELAGGGGGAR